jgi:hypothetical protein
MVLDIVNGYLVNFAMLGNFSEALTCLLFAMRRWAMQRIESKLAASGIWNLQIIFECHGPLIFCESTNTGLKLAYRYERSNRHNDTISRQLPASEKFTVPC